MQKPFEFCLIILSSTSIITTYMAEQKTKPSERSVEAFLDSLDNEEARDDCYTLLKMMTKITKAEPKLWGGSIVGFGKYHYRYESGHEGDSCLTGFSPRKQALTIYLMPGFESHSSLLGKLGKHKSGKGCLYIKKLKDVDPKVLDELIRESVSWLKAKYPPS
jgi:hypothetical protein